MWVALFWGPPLSMLRGAVLWRNLPHCPGGNDPSVPVWVTARTQMEHMRQTERSL